MHDDMALDSRPAADRASGRTDWAAVWTLYGAGVITAFQVGKVPPAMPLLRDDLGISLVTAGWGLSILSVVGLVFGLQAGGLVDRFGNRRTMLAGLALAILAAAAAALATGAVSFLAARLLEGIGHLMVVVAGPVLIVRVTASEDLPLALALWASFLTVGFALMGVAAPPLMELGGWRLLFWVNVALLAAAMAAVALVLRGGAARPGLAEVRPAPLTDRQSWIAALVTAPLAIYSHPKPVLLAYAFAAYCISAFAFLGLLPTFLTERIGLSLALAATITSAVALAALVGIFGAGVLMRRGVRFTTILTASFVGLAVIGPALYWVALPVPVVVAGCLAFQACAGLAVFAAVPETAPADDRIGLTNGLLAQTGNLGNLVGPPAMAWLIVTLAWEAAPIQILAASAVGIGLVALLARLHR
ncbi:MAG: MFS transporter [Alphaproteobacteria bacterium]|jgi:MFS family permease|nr:MFS transporter [Alphaproteobacteria bacterium]